MNDKNFFEPTPVKNNNIVSESNLHGGQEQLGKVLEKENLEEINIRAYVEQVT